MLVLSTCSHRVWQKVRTTVSPLRSQRSQIKSASHDISTVHREHVANQQLMNGSLGSLGKQPNNVCLLARNPRRWKGPPGWCSGWLTTWGQTLHIMSLVTGENLKGRQTGYFCPVGVYCPVLMGCYLTNCSVQQNPAQKVLKHIVNYTSGHFDLCAHILHIQRLSPSKVSSLLHPAPLTS